MPVEIFNQVHECCGCHKEDTVFPGLKKSEMLAIIPDLIVPENQNTDEEGWFKLDHVETQEESIVRAKEVIKTFKEMSKKEENQGKTFLFVSHGAFLATLLKVLSGQPKEALDPKHIPENNSFNFIKVVPPQEGSDRASAELLAFNVKT